MWETLQHNADKDFFQDSDFAGDLEESKSTPGEHCAFSEAIHLFQSVGCVRNNFQFRTVSTDSEIVSFGCRFKDGRYTRA